MPRPNWSLVPVAQRVLGYQLNKELSRPREVLTQGVEIPASDVSLTSHESYVSVTVDQGASRIQKNRAVPWNDDVDTPAS